MRGRLIVAVASLAFAGCQLVQNESQLTPHPRAADAGPHADGGHDAGAGAADSGADGGGDAGCVPQCAALPCGHDDGCGGRCSAGCIAPAIATVTPGVVLIGSATDLTLTGRGFDCPNVAATVDGTLQPASCTDAGVVTNVQFQDPPAAHAVALVNDGLATSQPATVHADYQPAPASASYDGNVTIAVTGTGFDPAATAALSGGGANPTVTAVSVSGAPTGAQTASLTLNAKAAAGSYTVTVTNEYGPSGVTSVCVPIACAGMQCGAADGCGGTCGAGSGCCGVAFQTIAASSDRPAIIFDGVSSSMVLAWRDSSGAAPVVKAVALDPDTLAPKGQPLVLLAQAAPNTPDSVQLGFGGYKDSSNVTWPYVFSAGYFGGAHLGATDGVGVSGDGTNASSGSTSYAPLVTAVGTANQLAEVNTEGNATELLITSLGASPTGSILLGTMTSPTSPSLGQPIWGASPVYYPLAYEEGGTPAIRLIVVDGGGNPDPALSPNPAQLSSGSLPAHDPSIVTDGVSGWIVFYDQAGELDSAAISSSYVASASKPVYDAAGTGPVAGVRPRAAMRGWTASVTLGACWLDSGLLTGSCGLLTTAGNLSAPEVALPFPVASGQTPGVSFTLTNGWLVVAMATTANEVKVGALCLK